MAFFIYDRPIGDVVGHKDAVYKIVEAPNNTCQGCALEHDEKLCNEFPFYCTEEYRCDKKNIIFEKLAKIIQNK